MGCIILEFIVWLVSGRSGLAEFNKKIVNEFKKECQYFHKEGRNGKTCFEVHQAVRSTMQRLSGHTQCEYGKTALGDLLWVVETKLLVVDLEVKPLLQGDYHDDGANTQVRTRATAMTLKAELDRIIERGVRNQTYWLKGKICDGVPSLYATQVVFPEPNAQGSLTVARDRSRSSGSSRRLLTTDTCSSSLIVPVLTENPRVGWSQNPPSKDWHRHTSASTANTSWFA